MHRFVLALLLLLWGPGAGAMTIERVASPGGIEAWLVEDHTLAGGIDPVCLPRRRCARPAR